MFRATLCPSSGADDLVVFFHVWCSGCVGSATYFPMDTQVANRIWLPTQPRHYTTREKIPLSRQLLRMGTRWPETCWITYKEQLIRRNKYNTKWHLVGFLFHTVIRCTFRFVPGPPLFQIPETCFVWLLRQGVDRLQGVYLQYLLTYSMVQSPSWEVNWFAASQEIPRISRNPKIHYRTHKLPPPLPIQGLQW